MQSIKLHIGIPVPNIYGNHTSVMWALQLVAMQKPNNVAYSVSQLPFFSAARNALVNSFLNSEDNYLLFIDADVVPPVDGFQRLAAQCEKYDVVSGLYFEKRGCGGPVAYNEVSIEEDGHPMWHRLEKWNGTTIPVEAVGMGFCLIPRCVFDKIETPYFYLDFDEKGFLRIGEDLYFCKKVRDAGFSIGLDTGCRCAHINAVNEPIASPRKPSS